MLNLDVVNENNYPINNKLLFQIAKTARQKNKKLTGLVEVIIIGDKEMKNLNRRWRNINKTTDVLPFAWEEKRTPDQSALGQIFISYPRLKVQAKENKISVKEELAVIFAHGLLHLIGYDHATLTGETKMFTLQNKIAGIALKICQ